jgi:fumarylacetoacetase
MLASWLTTANDGSTDFPIQNLPFGIFSTKNHDQRIGIAIGDQVLDLRECAQQGLFDDIDRALKTACQSTMLNPLMSLGRPATALLRKQVTELLRTEASASVRKKVEQLLVLAADVTMHRPAVIGDYTDFYASIYHATNVGRLFRPDHPLLPNYKHIPIGYHGRASSIVISGTSIRRPNGQTKAADAEQPDLGPSRLLDYELEVGWFIGKGNAMGETIPLDQAEDHIFGLCLLNDWSARDIQAWEYQPLGPFLAKNFATSISPWVVTIDALEPFRSSAVRRESGDPQPLPYLDAQSDKQHGGIDIDLEVWLASRRMREEEIAPMQLSKSNTSGLYWTLGQMLTHHASNGCNLQPGDLLGTGTVSGSGKNSQGCLLEITHRGTEPIQLPTGEMRRFLEDGDEVILRGYCEREGYPRIGFGECRGTILPAT